MLIYNIIFGMNFILGFINLLSRKQKKIYTIFSFLILDLFLCLNYLNGIDWINYQLRYIQLPLLKQVLANEQYNLLLPIQEQKEILFYYQMVLFKSFGFNYELYQYIILTIILYVIYKKFTKFTDYKLIGIFIYLSPVLLVYFFEPLLRQLLVFVIFLWSIEDILRRNYKKYFLKIFGAIFFHNSAVVFLPIYFFALKRIKLKFIIILFLILINLNKYMFFIFEKIKFLYPFLERYKFYFDDKTYGLQNSINFIFYIKIIASIILIKFILTNKDKLKLKNNKSFLFCINMFWVNEIIFILKRQVVIFFRLQMYFEIFYIVIICFFLEIIKKKYGWKIATCFYLLITLFYYRAMYIGLKEWEIKDKAKFFPYTNYLYEVIVNKDINEHKKIETRNYLKNKL